VDIMNNADSSRFSVGFEIMDEETARAKLRSGDILGFCRVPEGFVDGAARGEFIPVDYVSEGNDIVLAEALLREFIDVAQKLGDEVQRGVFGTERYLVNKGVDRTDIDRITDDMALAYGNYLLARNETLALDVVGENSDVTLGEYYFSSFSLFFTMLFGIGCAAHLVKKDMALPKLLSSRKIGAVRQILSENAAYFIFTYVFVFILLALGGAVLSQEATAPMFGGANFPSFLLYALRMAPAVFMITALQILLYECVDGVVGGVLLQFVTAISIAYVSGYFYPSSFFPQGVQKFALMTPGGVAFSYAKRAFVGTGSEKYLIPVLAYAVLFVALGAVIRRIRLGGDGA